MSSKINTLDHLIMGILLKSDRGLSIGALIKLSKSPSSRVRGSLYKLVDAGFAVRRVDCRGLSLYYAVLGSSYFPPVAYVSARDFLHWDDKEFSALVAKVERQAAKGAH